MVVVEVAHGRGGGGGESSRGAMRLPGSLERIRGCEVPSRLTVIIHSLLIPTHILRGHGRHEPQLRRDRSYAPKATASSLVNIQTSLKCAGNQIKFSMMSRAYFEIHVKFQRNFAE